MSALESAELERLSNLFALGSLENAQEIVELLSIELDGPPLSPNSESLQLSDEWPDNKIASERLNAGFGPSL